MSRRDLRTEGAHQDRHGIEQPGNLAPAPAANSDITPPQVTGGTARQLQTSSSPISEDTTTTQDAEKAAIAALEPVAVPVYGTESSPATLQDHAAPSPLSREEKITKLLSLGLQSRRQDRLLIPARRNAYYYYQQVLELEPDNPLEENFGKCDLCLSVCPTGAIYAPYRCDVTRCIDFHLGHNKLDIPLQIREQSSNLMGEGCTACRDICPKNRNLKPIEGFETPRELLHPSLLKMFDMTDDQWEQSFATTLMGFFLMDKKYLQRNAAIGLGNFQDGRALSVLKRFLETGDDDVRGYAAWAIGRIGGIKAKDILKTSFSREENIQVKQEIERSL